ncbi:Uncharacterised protein [Achromobacter xylosoxidans]|nr:Uncharacterised protein [Achromobacter xylosoxidans]CUK00474.1 Uncharacterised protein [Achromobacter xylosoxidans]
MLLARPVTADELAEQPVHSGDGEYSSDVHSGVLSACWHETWAVGVVAAAWTRKRRANNTAPVAAVIMIGSRDSSAATVARSAGTSKRCISKVNAPSRTPRPPSDTGTVAIRIDMGAANMTAGRGASGITERSMHQRDKAQEAWNSKLSANEDSARRGLAASRPNSRTQLMIAAEILLRARREASICSRYRWPARSNRSMIAPPPTIYRPSVQSCCVARSRIAPAAAKHSVPMRPAILSIRHDAIRNPRLVGYEGNSRVHLTRSPLPCPGRKVPADAPMRLSANTRRVPRSIPPARRIPRQRCAAASWPPKNTALPARTYRPSARCIDRHSSAGSARLISNAHTTTANAALSTKRRRRVPAVGPWMLFMAKSVGNLSASSGIERCSAR